MTGHVRRRRLKLASGETKTLWYVVVELPNRPDGRRHQKWHGSYSTRREADQARARLVGELQDGSYVEPSRLTLEEWIDGSWLRQIDSRAKPTTVQAYRSRLRTHILPSLGNRSIQSIRSRDLDGLYSRLLVEGNARNGRGLHPHTVREIHLLFHVVFSDAIDAGLLGSNPADKATPPRRIPSRRRPIRAWSEDELGRFIHAIAHEHLMPLIHVAAFTGLRRGELCALRWRHIDFDRARAHVLEAVSEVAGSLVTSTPKAGAGRTVDLDPRTLRLLADQKAARSETTGDDVIFLGLDGQRMRPNYLSERFPRLCEIYGLPRLRFHDLRHTHATLMLKADVPVHVVSQRLGHANAAMTLNVYAHVLPGMQAEAATRVASLILGSEPMPMFDVRLTQPPSEPRPGRSIRPDSASFRPIDPLRINQPSRTLKSRRHIWRCRAAAPLVTDNTHSNRSRVVETGGGSTASAFLGNARRMQHVAQHARQHAVVMVEP